ncbi:MAG: cytochrome c biogenesis protein [Melioribacter sp.]|nr:cytochrome c biogenesis protein [Melioribacter sp.]
MISTLKGLNFIIPVIYLIVFLIYSYDFFSNKNAFKNSKRIFLFVTLFVHAFYLILRTLEFDHPPITTKFEIFTLLAFSISFSYFILELLTDIRGTGLFIIFFSFLFQVISSIFIEYNYVVPEVLRNRMLGLHVISAILGYSGFTLSAVYGILFLLLYKNLRSSKFGLIFNRLPSLEVLEKLSYYSVVIGFVLLTIAIIIGAIWLPSAFPNFSYLDPKLVGTSLVWIAYLIGIGSKILSKWYGKKVIIFSLIGFAFTIISLIITSTFGNTFHSFY